MPAGCQFVCMNPDCEHNGTGFEIKAPWPIAHIDCVLDSSKVQADSSLKEIIEKMKRDGRDYACINYPDPDGLHMNGYRMELWCDKCPRIWSYDLLLKNPEDTFEELLAQSDVPDNCVICDSPLMSFEDCLGDMDDDETGIRCPYCKQKMLQQRWYCTEKVGENE